MRKRLVIDPRWSWLVFAAIGFVGALLVTLPLALSTGPVADPTPGVARIDLHLKRAALDRIRATRARALRETHGILLSEDGDWVGGKLIAWNGGRPVQRKIRLRVKGDWADHLKGVAMPSLRIKVRGGQTVFGMRRFSLQAPQTRNFQYEPLLLDELRDAGVIAPRYRFVEVRLNGERIGIMALEEHFEKEMLEHARRREAPILAPDETDLWTQRVINRRYPKRLANAGISVNQANLLYETYPVRFFDRVDAGSATAVELVDRARGLLRGFMEGHLPADRVFDLETTARWITIMNVFAAYHGMIDHNRRFYFNPILDRLEPIAFDNDAMHRVKQKRRIKLPVEGRHLLASPEFVAYLRAFAEHYARWLEEPSTRTRLQRRFDGYTRILARDDDFDAFHATLKERIERFRLQIEKAVSNARSPLRTVGRTPKWIAKFLDGVPELARIAHVYVWRRGDQTVLEVQNLTGAPLTLDALLVDGFLGRAPIALGTEIPPYYRGGPLSTRLVIPGDGLALGDPVMARLTYRGEVRTIPAHWYGPPLEEADDGRFETPLDAVEIAGVRLDRAHRLVEIGGKAVRFERSIRFPKGYRTEVAAGTEITLAPGVMLTFDGPLDLAGTPEAPVTIVMAPGAPERNRWGGLLIRRSGAESRWRHFRIVARGGGELPERQDGGGLTGCVTLYEADVVMQDGHFENLVCEDALNVVRSAFALERVTISGARFDAFDADFSEGRAHGSAFLDAGNDGLDVSGSVVSVAESRFERLGDKAISVGERSQLTARGIVVDAVPLGVVSKDLSTADVQGSTFRNVRDAVFAAYQKKPEFGPGSIVAQGNTITDANHLWAVDEQSEVRLLTSADGS